MFDTTMLQHTSADYRRSVRLALQKILPIGHLPSLAHLFVFKKSRQINFSVIAVYACLNSIANQSSFYKRNKFISYTTTELEHALFYTVSHRSITNALSELAELNLIQINHSSHKTRQIFIRDVSVLRTVPFIKINNQKRVGICDLFLSMLLHYARLHNIDQFEQHLTVDNSVIKRIKRELKLSYYNYKSIISQLDDYINITNNVVTVKRSFYDNYAIIFDTQQNRCSDNVKILFSAELAQFREFIKISQ